MKVIDYDAVRQPKARESAFKTVNMEVRKARQEYLFGPKVTPEMRKLYFVRLRRSWEQAFQNAGITLPLGTNVLARSTRLKFIDSLSLEQRIALSKAVSQLTTQIADALGMEEIKDLEEQRTLHMDGVASVRSQEDARTVAQLARDTVENVKAKHRPPRQTH